jgi:hypothetical protein
VFAGSATTASLTFASTASAQLDEVNAKQLRDAVTVDGILQHERALQTIVSLNGGTRASGTPGYEASLNYVKGRLDRTGYTTEVQQFTFPFFRDLEPATLSQVSPTAPTRRPQARQARRRSRTCSAGTSRRRASRPIRRRSTAGLTTARSSRSGRHDQQPEHEGAERDVRRRRPRGLTLARSRSGLLRGREPRGRREGRALQVVRRSAGAALAASR